MSDNKFIKHLRGEDTSKSVLEIKNQRTTTSFANMPQGTSNANDVYSDHRGNAVAVLKGTDNWKLNNNALTLATTVYGDGRDFTDEYSVGGAGLWVNAVYTFTDSKIFMPNTKWVLKLCGNRLFTESHEPIALTLLIKFGTSTLISKTFFVRENSFNFSEELVIDFDESISTPIKVAVGDTMTIQVLCGDATAQATIYNGMTVFTALQRRVDGDSVASDKKTFDEAVQDIDDINQELDDLEEYVDDTFVRLDGSSIMTAPLKFMSGSMRGAVGPYFNGVGFWKLDSQGNLTQIASISDSQFIPTTTETINFGNSTKKWKNLYLSGKTFVATINNGGDLAVPANTTGTLATKADVDLAANSGRMITDQGVWYAKMYAGTTPPVSAEVEGRNYADFSQTDGQDNPIIVIYTYTNGAWDNGTTIVPPADYDGYVPITSKIWDISEQAGQQGGRVLWNHQSKDFTPYPLIVSFDGQNITNSTFSYGTISYSYVNAIGGTMDNMTITNSAITNSTFSGTATLSGDSTITMSENPTDDSIVNKEYVDTHAGTSSYHPDLFDWKWADSLRNDVQWLRADTFSWQSGAVYQAAYKHLRNDMFNWYSWEDNGTTIYTKKAYPEVGEKAYSDSALTTEVGEITDVTDTLDITVEKITVNSVVYDSVSGSNIAPTTETVGGVTVQYIPAEDGHKIVTDFHESEIADVYAATGVAWYYIIDYGLKRFKLPRTKFGVTGLRDTVGKYIEAGLPNITGAATLTASTSGSTGGTGAMAGSSNSGTSNYGGGNSADNNAVIRFDASSSNSIYGASTTVQPPATQMYLYFYVGNFTQTAIENTAGITAETLNDKVDKGHEVIAFQAPTAQNNHTWYRKYADGWVEQGGRKEVSSFSLGSGSTYQIGSVVFPVATSFVADIGFGDNMSFFNVHARNYTTTGMDIYVSSQLSVSYTQSNCYVFWEVKGMAAS